MTKRAVKLCKEEECKNVQTTMGYCRLHYLKNWKKIREKQKKKAAKNLNKYIEHIMKRHPDNYLEAVKHDLSNSGRFQKRAEEYFGDVDFHDIMDDVDMGYEIEKVIDHLKVEDIY